MGRIQDKVAIVTGSTLGIGAAVARLFAQEGACVVLNSHRDDAAAAAMRAQLDPARSLFVQGDVADKEAMGALAEQAMARFGRIDIVVNNAGMNMFTDPLEMTDDQWRRCCRRGASGSRAKWPTRRCSWPATKHDLSTLRTS